MVYLTIWFPPTTIIIVTNDVSLINKHIFFKVYNLFMFNVEQIVYELLTLKIQKSRT